MATGTKPYIELAKRHRLDNAAIGLILHVARLLGLSFGVHLAQVRQNADRLMGQEALVAEVTLRLHQEQRANALLRARLAKLDPASRPRYTPPQRVDDCDLSLDARAQGRSRGQDRGLARQADTPIRRIADDIRYLVQLLRAAGLNGPGMIARVLPRAGVRISPTTARRIVKRGRSRQRPPPHARPRSQARPSRPASPITS
jgi:hypothetical protein